MSREQIQGALTDGMIAGPCPIRIDTPAVEGRLVRGYAERLAPVAETLIREAVREALTEALRVIDGTNVVVPTQAHALGARDALGAAGLSLRIMRDSEYPEL